MMSELAETDQRQLPSVDAVMRTQVATLAIEQFGRSAVVDAVRAALGTARAQRIALGAEHAATIAFSRLAATTKPRLRAVYNLTGTVLHTNLGRAVLADAAITAAVVAMRNAVALEFDLATGRRGERDNVLRDLLRQLTGAEDGTVVNNNAAAILLVLNTFANKREVIISRGELIEIGGAFRMPEIMSRAGAKLVEVGTTNRTHLKDYAGAIGAKSGMILKVHTSNYSIKGFTTNVPVSDLKALAGQHGVPLVDDLGSGTIIDLARYGLAHEPTVAEAVRSGADIVTFSGDKLLGGPQAGFIVGRSDLIARVNHNSMKRALRVDKIRLAAIEATLKLYRDPDRLAERLPTFRFLARPSEEIVALARRLEPVVAAKVCETFAVKVVGCMSQIGSGALPLETVPSAGLAIRPKGKRGAGRALSALASALRDLPMPVIGRMDGQALILDLRCLEDESGFAANLEELDLKAEDGNSVRKAPS
jgi:L-seryl-tRNA(Ser) seleniumtransferase